MWTPCAGSVPSPFEAGFLHLLAAPSSADPYLASWLFPFYSHTAGLSRMWNWNHSMPRVLICIILYLPTQQTRAGKRWIFAELFTHVGSLSTVAGRCGDFHETSLYFSTWNFPHSNKVTSPAHKFHYKKRDVVGGVERWGLCSLSGYTH